MDKQTVIIGLEEYKTTLLVMSNLLILLEDARKYFEQTNSNPAWVKLYSEALEINNNNIMKKAN